MASKRTQRKLAAILHADVAGSTALVQRDEAVAHERLTEAFNRLAQAIRKFGGTVHEIRGDALVAEFSRASDSVCAALTFQQSNREHLELIADEIRPTVRIGISLGEVVIADGTVTGPGVVLAQRVEQLAEPNGLTLTAAVHEAVPRRLPFSYTDLGKRELKGFDEKIQVYSVTLRSGGNVPPPEATEEKVEPSKFVWTTSAAVVMVLMLTLGGLLLLQPWKPTTEPAERLKIPAQPSVAVLPLDNLTGDAEQRYFADGISEDLITDLSKLRGMFVVARNSSFRYRDESVDVRQIGKDLGVRYVIEGSVRKLGDRIRINVQLVDTETGGHLWAQRYDRPLSDIFKIQDEVLRNVVGALDVKLVEGEQAGVWRRSTNSVEAYDLFLHAHELILQFTREANFKAVELLNRALEVDPEFARAWVELGWANAVSALFGWADSSAEAYDRAFEAALKAHSLDDNSGDAHILLAELYFDHKGDDEKGQAELEKAISLNPANAKILAIASIHLSKQRIGRSREALDLIQRAMRINPLPPAWYFYPLGRSLLGEKQYEEAISAFDDCVSKLPNHLMCRVYLVQSYLNQGSNEQARQKLNDVLRINPDFEVKEFFSEREIETLGRSDTTGKSL